MDLLGSIRSAATAIVLLLVFASSPFAAGEQKEGDAEIDWEWEEQVRQEFIARIQREEEENARKEAEFIIENRCEAVEPIRADNWEELDVGSFRVMVPPGWEYIEGQGMDTIIGVITNGTQNLGFEYGWWAGSLDRWRGPDFDRTCLIIDGHAAIVISEDSPTRQAVGIDVPFLPLSSRLTIAGVIETPEQKQVALGIFKSIRW